MIDWGFGYIGLANMPLDEFYHYIKLLNKHQVDERNFITAPKQQANDPKPIGAILPRK